MFSSSALMPSFASMPFSTWLAPVNQVVTVLPLKSCSVFDRPVLAGDEDERRDLMRDADADDRQALVARREHAVGAAGQAERIGAGRDQIFGQQIGAAGIDGEIDAFGLVVALCQRDVEAGELRLRQPLQTQARLGELLGRGGELRSMPRPAVSAAAARAASTWRLFNIGSLHGRDSSVASGMRMLIRDRTDRCGRAGASAPAIRARRE